MGSLVEEGNEQMGPGGMSTQQQLWLGWHQQLKWLPRSLELLFGGQKEVAMDEQLRRAARQQAYIEEACLMELLADKEVDEERIPDAGELEGGIRQQFWWLTNLEALITP